MKAMFHCQVEGIDSAVGIANNSHSKTLGQRIMTYCKNRNNWIISMLVVVLLTLLPGKVLADRGQWLAGISAGTSTLEPDAEGSPFQLDQTGSTGYKLYLGYDLAAKITFEAFYVDLGEVTFSNGGALSYTFYGLGGSYYFPENSEGSAIFVKAGVGKINVSGDIPFKLKNSVQMYVGAGIEVQFGSGIALRGEYEYYDIDAQMFSLSLNKRFGVVRSIVPDWAQDLGAGMKEQDEGPGFTVINSDQSQLDQGSIASSLDNQQLPEQKSLVMKDVSQLTDILGVIEGVDFIKGTSELTVDSAQSLNQLAQSMASFKDIQFVIIGHTNDVGDIEANKNLSLTRAMAVGIYLQSQGVSAGILSYLGAGESEPIARNSTPEGRSLNQRVELLLQ